MIRNSEALKKQLILNNVAKDYELVGCSSQEIADIEEKYGSLPSSYKQILKLLGRRGGRLFIRGEFQFYIQEILKINEEWLECAQDFLEESNLPKNVFIICARYEADTWEVVLTNNGDDSPVFVLGDTYISKVSSSVWEWIEIYLEYAKRRMQIKMRMQRL